jgi:hypothetical protein
MSEATPRRSDSSRVAVAMLGTIIVLGGAYGLTRLRGGEGKAGADDAEEAEPPSLFAVGAAAGSVARRFDAAVYDNPEDHSPTIEACRELRRSGVVSGCVPDGARGEVGELTRFVDGTGQTDGRVVRMNDGTSIDGIVAAMIAEKDAGRPCEVVGSPGSRMIAILGRNMSCDVVPQVRAALDRQSTVTMLACLEIVSWGPVSQCESRGSLAITGDGQMTRFLDEKGEYYGGGISHLSENINIPDEVETLREERSHKIRPCEVVGSPSSHMIAVLPPLLSCDEVPRVRAAMDHFAPHEPVGRDR